MKIRVRAIEFAVEEVRTRLPFRFGQVTLREGLLLTARVGIEKERGETSMGFASDLCVPKWFEKDAQKSVAEDVQALVTSAREAAAAFLADREHFATVFEHWWRAYRLCVESVPFEAKDRLVRSFGVAILERALLDATARAGQVSFFEALEENLFGFQPGAVRSELKGFDLARALRKRPLERIAIRHTVGMLDPLREGEIEDAERLHDGLPQSLEAEIAAEGLSYFKIKIRGDLNADLSRLEAIGDLLIEAQVPEPRITLDGNEQVEDLALIVELLQRLERTPAGQRIRRGLLWLEQPLPRARSFETGALNSLAALPTPLPVILDEADCGAEAFPRALELGYRGISMKCCKGIFRTLIHRGLCELHPGAFLAGEDLTNLPVLALQQDFAVAAALGLEHVERNGHHYFRGLDHLPRGEAEDALRVHSDLYTAKGNLIHLHIQRGAVQLGSLQRNGLGYDIPIRFEERMPLDTWQKSMAE